MRVTLRFVFIHLERRHFVPVVFIILHFQNNILLDLLTNFFLQKHLLSKFDPFDDDYCYEVHEIFLK